MRRFCRCTHATHETICTARGWTIEKSRPFEERKLTISFPGTASSVYGETKRKIDRQPVRGTTSSSSDPMPTPHRKNRSRARETSVGTPPNPSSVKKAATKGWSLSVISKDDEPVGASEDIYAEIPKLAGEGLSAEAIQERVMPNMREDDPVYSDLIKEIKKAVAAQGKSGGKISGSQNVGNAIQKAEDAPIEDQRIDEEGLAGALEAAEDAMSEHEETPSETYEEEQARKRAAIEKALEPIFRDVAAKSSCCQFCQKRIVHTEESCSNLMIDKWVN